MNLEQKAPYSQGTARMLRKVAAAIVDPEERGDFVRLNQLQYSFVAKDEAEMPRKHPDADSQG